MQFRPHQIKYFIETMAKLERYFAYKYEVEKHLVGFVLRGQSVHVMISGKLTESLTPMQFSKLKIDEQTLTIIK